MKIECRGCGREFDIPGERLPRDKQSFSFPCTGCGGAVEVRVGRARPEGAKPAGDALKARVLKTLKDLPPMPHSVVKARQVMADPNSSFKDLADLFEKDQALATKVLRLANSAYYGLSGKVSSIQHASVLLGHQTLGELITMTGTSSLMGSNLEGYGLESGDLWLHSLAVALGSRLISREKAPDLADDAFMAGLIHDSGKLILDRHLLERKDALDSLLEEDGHTFLEAERRVLGFDHSEIASEACARWQIPDAIGEAVRHHHHPSRAGAKELACIVHVADLVAIMGGIGGGIDGTRYKMDRNAMELLDISPEDINHFMFDVMEGVKGITQEM